MRFLITGGAGFIGSAVTRRLLQSGDDSVLVLDKLTYAGNLSSLAPVANNPRFTFLKADICDRAAIAKAFAEFEPDLVMHLAAESHVDRSIDGPREFVETNVVGTVTMLEAALNYWRKLGPAARAHFRFHHISTDEVFGSLDAEGAFYEETRYDPRSPYSASKASADHFVRAWRHTYGLPTLVTNCSNNYGPYHFPEKLIPLTILNAFEEKPLPVYGRGDNVRDWLFVDDHAEALIRVAKQGLPGQSYNIGGRAERRNIDVVHAICDVLDDVRPRGAGSHRGLVRFVEDRPGHDLRYAIDCAKVERELGWTPTETFETGLRKTVIWFLENAEWWQTIRNNMYSGERLGRAS